MAVAKKKKKKYPPRKPRKIKFDVKKHCGHTTQDGSPCTKVKGYGTDHLGEGRCKFGGGGGKGKPSGRPPTHGLFRKLKSPALKKWLDNMEETEFDTMNLEPAARMLWGLTMDFVERYSDSTDALIVWHNLKESSIDDIFKSLETRNVKKLREGLISLRSTMSRRPDRILDITAASQLVDKIGKTVERIHKIQSERTITAAHLNEIYTKMTITITRHCDEKQLAKILHEWEGIQW